MSDQLLEYTQCILTWYRYIDYIFMIWTSTRQTLSDESMLQFSKNEYNIKIHYAMLFS